MVEQKITWIGLRVGDFLIKDLLGEGAFSWVYRGSHVNDGSPAAFKVAKPADVISAQPVVQKTPTQAVGFFTGGVQGVHPDAVQLLSLQASKINAANDSRLARVEQLVQEDGFGYYRMELIEGKTLRQKMQEGPVPLSVLMDTAQAMDRLSRQSMFQFHGDLKPENIMVSDGGITIIDPGHFGELECEEGHYFNAAITTPAYYPFMEPDDLFAFGLILWEAATGSHPLIGKEDDVSLDPEVVTPDLAEWIRSYEQVGLYFLRPVCLLRHPSEFRPDLDPEAKELLLRSLGLRIDPEGRLDRGPRFQSFAELADALQSMIGSEISHL